MDNSSGVSNPVLLLTPVSLMEPGYTAATSAVRLPIGSGLQTAAQRHARFMLTATKQPAPRCTQTHIPGSLGMASAATISAATRGGWLRGYAQGVSANPAGWQEGRCCAGKALVHGTCSLDHGTVYVCVSYAHVRHVCVLMLAAKGYGPNRWRWRRWRWWWGRRRWWRIVVHAEASLHHCIQPRGVACHSRHGLERKLLVGFPRARLDVDGRAVAVAHGKAYK